MNLEAERLRLERIEKGYSFDDIGLIWGKNMTVCKKHEDNANEEYAKLIYSLPPKYILLMRKRIEAGMAVEEVAARVNRKPSAVERWERGAYMRGGERGIGKWTELFYPRREKKVSSFTASSLCWNCAKVGKTMCSWDASKGSSPVDGATWHETKNGKIMITCPLYEEGEQ